MTLVLRPPEQQVGHSPASQRSSVQRSAVQRSAVQRSVPPSLVANSSSSLVPWLPPGGPQRWQSGHNARSSVPAIASPATYSRRQIPGSWPGKDRQHLPLQKLPASGVNVRLPAAQPLPPEQRPQAGWEPTVIQSWTRNETNVTSSFP